MSDIYKCFMCGDELTEENSSDEHILLNALGGHIHSKKLICKNCNSALGSTSDDELAKELNFFASFLDVPRQRGKNQIIKTLDEKYDLMPGGVPVLRQPIGSRLPLYDSHGRQVGLSCQRTLQRAKQGDAGRQAEAAARYGTWK